MDNSTYKIHGVNGPVVTVTGGRGLAKMSLVYVGDLELPGEVVSVKGDKSVVQVYEDTGAGYSEEQSCLIPDAYQSEEIVEFTYEVSGNVKMLRIDPAFDSCVCRILEMTFNGEEVPLEKRKVMITNGRVLKGEVPGVVFPTTDPNINIGIRELNPKASNQLYVRMEVVRLPLEIARDMAAAVKKLL